MNARDDNHFITAAEDLAIYRFVKSDGTYADAGEMPVGNTGGRSADSGNKTQTILPGQRIKAVASAAIVAGARIVCAADGKAAMLGAGAGQYVVGYALTAADADDDQFEMYYSLELIPTVA